MITDLARRNISRICGKLGVEHILISADIVRKRRYIRNNVLAWLKKPAVGTIPLFMAGDKQYFYYHRRVCRQLGVNLAIQGSNRLERTYFKSGFAGVSPCTHDPHNASALTARRTMQLAFYYAWQFLTNPAYLNASVADTLCGFASYYVIPHYDINLYNYISWNEPEIVGTLRREYDFELASDTNSTWRIGDGTAAFYNYIYYTLAGFTENDTFRSNQIRENLISREEALARVREENKPRYESIQWYLDIINLGLGLEQVLRIIHSIPESREVPAQ
jgi:hypothetical protein